MVQCTLQEGGMGEKEPQKKFVFRRKPFFLFLLFFLINSMTSCFRMVLSMEFHLQIFLGLLGSALLAAEFFYLPVKKWVRVLLIAGFEIFFLLSQTFYDFCFFITGSDITKEALGNIGVLQMDAAFALWKFWFFFGGGYFLICVACCVLLSLFYPREKGTVRWYFRIGILLVGLILVLQAPSLQVLYMTEIRNETYTSKEFSESGIKFSRLNKTDIEALPGKNILHIYLESFDSRFLDEKRFPELLPNLKKLMKEGLVFSHVSNAPLANYTFGGIYASIMGINAVPEHFSMARGVHGGIRYQYGAQMPSLVSILKQAGYFQTFLNGPDIQFAGMGPFLKREGMDEALSYKKEFQIREWTCSDVQLFEWGYEKYRNLRKRGRPFHLILLTIDTHSVTGFPHSRMIPYDKIPGTRKQILDLFHTTDFYLGEFIRKVRSTPGSEDTCIIITSDHTVNWSYLYPALFQGLSAPGYHIAFALNTGKRGICDVPAMTFDMAPTILSLAGVRHNYPFPLGEDLTKPESLNPNRLRADRIHPNIVSSFMKIRNPEEYNLKMLDSIEILTTPYFLLKLNKEIIFFPTVTIPRENEFIYFDFSFDRKIRLCRTYPAYKVKILNEFQKMPYYGVITRDSVILRQLFPRESFQENLWYMVLACNGKIQKVSGRRIEDLKIKF